MATSSRIRCLISTPRTFLGCSYALLCSSAGTRLNTFSLPITAINPYFTIVNLTITAIRFTSIAFLTKQLNIRSVTLTATGERNNVIIFQVNGTAATLADATIPRKYNLFRGFRNISTLTKTGKADI